MLTSRWLSAFSASSLGLALIFGGLGCQPVNVQEQNKKAEDDKARPQRENRTQLSRFYGSYQTLEQSGKSVTSKIQAGRTELKCDTVTEIDNANISRYRAPVNGAMKLETIVLDFFDPRTKEFLPADEIWVSSGVIRDRSGNEVCGDFAVPLFANRGQWKQLENGFEYEFHGTLLERSNEGDDQFDELHIDEFVRVRRLSDGVEIKIKYDSKHGYFDEVWKVKAESQNAGAANELPVVRR